ncbi:MAG: hypothetical protein WAT39_24025 [Planctomycetota bacterium]
MERDNAARVARGAQPRHLHDSWTNRPRLNVAEQLIWAEFLRFARFCGGDPRPPDALAWFDMRGVAQAEREWLAEVFSAMAAVVRERPDDD